MRKKKWKKILIWTISVVVFVGIGGLFAANYAVDKLISTLDADLESDLLSEETVDPDTQTDQQETEQRDQNLVGVDEAVTDLKDDNGNVAKEETKDLNTEDRGSKEPVDDNKSTNGYSAEVSVEKAKDLEEKITVSEKAQVSTVLLKELSLSDIKELQALVSGGMSVEEKKQARSIILDKLSPEQYDELIQVAKKYGMSQGKSYDEVIQDK